MRGDEVWMGGWKLEVGGFYVFRFVEKLKTHECLVASCSCCLPPNFDFLGLLQLISLNVEMTTIKFWTRTYSNNIDVIGFEH